MGLFTPNIRKLKKEGNISELLKCLDHKRANVRYSAFVALAGESDLSGEIVSKLKQMLHDPDPWVKTIATLKFAELGDMAVADNLMEIIRKGSQNDKIDLLKIIAGRGATADVTIMQVIMDALADKKEIVRREAVTAAGATANKRLMPYLADRLKEKHRDLRVHTAKALYDIGGKESVDYLIGLLADRDSIVRAAARSYLEGIVDERAKRALHDVQFMQLIKGMNDKEPVRRLTARKIGDAVITEGLPLLHRACEDKFKEVRIEALKSIAVFKSPASIHFVAKLLDDKFHDVRLEAINTLELISDLHAVKALEHAVEDRNKQVSMSAQGAIDRMKRTL
jgi:HEAT repeat protein